VFLIYQQLENHILNPVVMSRTVRLNPLWVLLAILVGVEMGGIVGSTFGGLVGALLAVPAASAIQVIARDLWAGRRSGQSADEHPPDEVAAAPRAPIRASTPAQ
jgi:predicted PurR-regulated permease PerM